MRNAAICNVMVSPFPATCSLGPTGPCTHCVLCGSSLPGALWFPDGPSRAPLSVLSGPSPATLLLRTPEFITELKVVEKLRKSRCGAEATFEPSLGTQRVLRSCCMFLGLCADRTPHWEVTGPASELSHQEHRDILVQSLCRPRCIQGLRVVPARLPVHSSLSSII